MDRSPSHDSLTLLSLAALAAAAFCAAPLHAAPFSSAGLLDGLRAEGWQGVPASVPPAATAAPRTTPAAPRASAAPAPTKAVLSDDEIKILAQFTADYGLNMILDAPMTDALGLTSGGEKLKVRQLATDPAPGETRAYQRLNDGGFLVGNIRPDRSYKAYRANAQQELVGAVWIRPGRAPTVIPVADAQKELRDELLFWVAIARHR